ncbi:hypothetical protein DSO57_1007081 [Entomophthora muscae]|uniref:Uncharacterized protein n=1 Tax=Entomophthora muscae TaxID=34485 RepID=A0ACC2RYN3_9FUNG|nr:hypothetical protein DSO57_1007081 [Entomophthora muscae]
MKLFHAAVISLVSAITIDQAIGKAGSNNGYLDFASVDPQSVWEETYGVNDCLEGKCHLETLVAQKAYLALSYEGGFKYQDDIVKGLISNFDGKYPYGGISIKHGYGAFDAFSTAIISLTLHLEGPRPPTVISITVANVGDRKSSLITPLLGAKDKLLIRIASDLVEEEIRFGTWDRIKGHLKEMNKERTFLVTEEADAEYIHGLDLGIQIVIEELDDQFQGLFSHDMGICSED